MANFIAPDELVITTTLEFGEISENNINQFSCQDNEIAGFKIQQVGTNIDGTPCYFSQVFDCSSGTPILMGSTGIQPGMDLCGGLFSSGCFPDRSVFDDNCIFYKADY